MMGLMLFGQGIATTLIALGIGYIVCDLAAKREGFSKIAGHVIGTVIIVVGAVILINVALSSFIFGKRLSSLGIGGMLQPRTMQQPHMTPSMPAQNQTQAK